MGSRLRDLPILQDDDVVRLFDCREVVGDHENCSVVPESREGLLDILLRHSVKGCCGFVKDHDWGILELETR